MRTSGYNYTTDGMRFLYHPDENPAKKRKTRYFSVTSIIGRAWPAPFLEEWRNTNLFNALVCNTDNIVEKLAALNTDNIIEELKEGSKWDSGNIDIAVTKHREARELFDNVRNDTSAADRGTRIHKTIEMYLRTGDKHYISEHHRKNEEEGNIAASTLLWLRKNKIEPLYLEVPIWSTAPAIRYTGVVDLVVDGERFGYPDSWVYFDFKFGKNINPTYAMQLAAYASADECQLEGVDLLPNSKTHDAKNVYVAGVIHNHSGDVELIDVKLDDAWSHFCVLYKMFLLSMAYPKNVLKTVEPKDLEVSLV